MLNNFRNLRSLFGSHGARWLAFRVGYALRKQAGFLRKQMPMYSWADRPLQTWLREGVPSTAEAYASWRGQNSPAFFPIERVPTNAGWDPQSAVREAERILNGEVRYFAHRSVKTGFPPDWHEDPVSGVKLDSRKHWSEISDEGEVDIKLVWEASRFSMVYPLVRAYGFTRDERFAEAFWKLIESWAGANPPNAGPNWMDGQEAALRLLAWSFGYSQFFQSPSTTPQRVSEFTVMVAAHAERIHENIDYAISTHSNHTVSEAFGLWLVGLFFPELHDAAKYLALGRRLLEQEAAAQLFPDGTYSMYSLNYHRFVLHIYLCMARLAELNESPISPLILQRVYASIVYLSQLIDPATGKMPVYGSNDGALVLPLNHCDFTDYRPLLQLGSYLTKKEWRFDPGPWDEDVFWFYGAVPHSLKHASDERSARKMAFPDGGTYLLHNTGSKAILRCTAFRSRPSHADQLHVDLWVRGQNIACDAGTYLYSDAGIWRNGLAHTSVHNTVAVDGQDQMKRVTRFTWTNWSKGKVLRHDEKIWQGEHNGYRRLGDPVTHRRTVMSLGEARWLVVDHLEGSQPHHYALHWLLHDVPYEQQGHVILLSFDSMKYKFQAGLQEGQSDLFVVRADPNSTRGWRSQYYGDKEPALSAVLQTHQPRACFWTFFGMVDDSVQIEGELFKFYSPEATASINLQSLTTNS